MFAWVCEHTLWVFQELEPTKSAHYKKYSTVSTQTHFTITTPSQTGSVNLQLTQRLTHYCLKAGRHAAKQDSTRVYSFTLARAGER